MTKISLCNTYAKNLNTYTNKKMQTSFKSKKDDFKPTIVEGTQTYAKVYAATLDDATKKQIKNICSHPVFKDLPVRIMPDTHAGKDVVVGFTAPIGTSGEIIPGLVSGDIGCGMLCCEIQPSTDEIDFKKLDNVIRTYVSSHHDRIPTTKKNHLGQIEHELEDICSKKIGVSKDKMIGSLGTLGTGNHFIEIDRSDDGKTYLVIHTGSRGFGQAVFKHHRNIALSQNPYYIENLSYLTGDEAKEYLQDMQLAQKFSQVNRRIIADEIIKQMGWKEVDSFESIHNYIDKDGIIRKGAISAFEGQKAIIPLNMRDGALIVKGKGNPDWNNSAPHGAGRILSRMDASKKIDIEEYQKSMKGIYSSCVSKDTLDEAPQAYKNSDEIKKFISDTVKIKKVIRPKFNFKD